MSEGKISERSRRVARNTLLLYLRMLLLLVIGLFTSRLVLQALGEQDYGTYNAVYGMVMMFTLLSGSMSNAISRYMAFELGAAGVSGFSGSAGDSGSGSAGASGSDAAAGGGERLRKLFCSAILIQLALVLLLAKTVYRPTPESSDDKVYASMAYRLGKDIDILAIHQGKEQEGGRHYAHLVYRSLETIRKTTARITGNLSFALLMLCAAICVVFIYMIVLHN